MSQQDLDTLFPLPSTSRFPLVPSPWPGITPESTEKVTELLKQNHVNFHCFFNYDGFHNHLSHHLLAAYALGCTPSLLEAAYKLHADYQMAQKPITQSLTEQNWKSHLRNISWYPAYLQFFQAQILENGVSNTVEKYIFSADANYGEQNPRMFSRLLSGLLHPLIHMGHGPEFGLPGLAAEGLGMTALTHPMTGKLFPPAFFENPPKEPSEVHALTILGRILKDPKLAYGEGANPNSSSRFTDAIDRSGERIKEYCNEWSPVGNFEDKYQELVFLVCSIYGFSGWRPNQAFKANFFMLHLITSCLFLPSICALLSPSSQQLLLRGFLITAVTYWVGHGRQEFFIPEFYEQLGQRPILPPARDPTPAETALDKPHLYQNPWFPILQSALTHPDEHLVKIQRSLAHFSALYGTTRPGTFSQTELPNASRIDGSLFLYLAELTGQAKSWVREGEPDHDANWNRKY